jgi:secreted trypsin-like serine protease
MGEYRAVTSQKFVHPRYQITDRGANSYDFVMFKIEKVQNANIRPAVMNPDRSAVAAGSPGEVVGFGYTGYNEAESPMLLKGSVSTLDTADCERRYGRNPGFFDESVVCTIGSSSTSCFGDSGGPLLDQNGLLVGVISFGTQRKSPMTFSVAAFKHIWICFLTSH